MKYLHSLFLEHKLIHLSLQYLINALFICGKKNVLVKNATCVWNPTSAISVLTPEHTTEE